MILKTIERQYLLTSILDYAKTHLNYGVERDRRGTILRHIIVKKNCSFSGFGRYITVTTSCETNSCVVETWSLTGYLSHQATLLARKFINDNNTELIRKALETL